MRIFLHICFLVFSANVVAQTALVEDVKTYIATQQFDKARDLIEYHLEKSKDEGVRTALWYYKGRLSTDEYFDDNKEKDSDVVFRKKSYQLLEGIAAFQNTVKRQDPEYSVSALRQLGGLHRYLKDIAFSNLHKKQYERFYLNLDWARSCDRFVQSYVPKSADYEMDTMLLYLVAYGAELTGRNYKVKTCYETLLLEGIKEEQLFTDNYGMLMALGEIEKANAILEKGLLKHPNAIELLKSKLHWLMTNEYYEETIQFVNNKATVLPESEQARFHFVKGLAWDARYKEASRRNLPDADFYFKETEKAYQKAVGLSPKTFDFAYNLAALYYNKVVSIQPDSTPATAPNEDYALFIQRATETLESTLDLNTADRKVIDALEDIYKRTNQQEKLEQLNISKIE
ncbi:MAG: hypothetical protein AB8F74_11950 [Saprospiraceae bacterium]